MNDYIEHEVTFLERLENSFVKLALIARGSRKLFSNKQKAEEYLKEMENDDYSFSLSGHFPCNFEEKKILDTEYVVFEPKGGVKTNNVVFYLHGGAYVRHITKLHLKMIARLCDQSKARFVVPAYLTAPKCSFSKSAQQLVSVYKKEISKEENAILAGDSCGSAIAVCLLPKLNEENLPEVKKLFLFSPLLNHDIVDHRETERLSKADPMFGGTGGLGCFIESWSAGEQAADPMNIDFSLLKKTYIFTSKNDMLHAGCLDFFEKAKEAGADISLEIWKNMFHDFILYPVPSSKELLKTVSKLINE